MSCGWCSTPESQKFTCEIGCDDAKCIRCGLCVKLCPNRALNLDVNGFPRTIDGKCRGCGECRKNCPSMAISIYGNSMTAEEVVTEIEKDEVFYFHSGGGFTFSGGEALAQPVFVTEVFRLAAERGINGTIETSACVPWRNIEMVMPWVSRLYIDIKHMNSARHRVLTGLENELVLENIERIDNLGKQISIRVPIIPFVNDSQENIEATAEFCGRLRNITELELLSYHKLGMITYKKLGRDMKFQHVEPPSRETMLRIAKSIKLTLPNLSVKINGGEI